ncbi:MAG: FKBP-type peptidyl-prolyl cis-trans isomerase [Candidatus Bathyarchaeia archaeon]
MPLKNGDYAYLDYILKIKESGEIVDTTIEEVAKGSGLRKDGTFEPLFLIVGEGWVPKGLEEGLIGLEPGDKRVIEVPPEKGYGERDPSKLRLLPLRRFMSRNINPVPGMSIEMDGRTAIVRAVGAGRVQVDFNHPLAGKTLVYEVILRRILESAEEKIRAILHRRIPEVEPEKFGISIGDGKLEVEIPEDAFYLEGLQLAKRAAASDLEKYMPELEEISFVEVFRRKAAGEGKPAEAQSQ